MSILVGSVQIWVILAGSSESEFQAFVAVQGAASAPVPSNSKHYVQVNKSAYETTKHLEADWSQTETAISLHIDKFVNYAMVFVLANMRPQLRGDCTIDPLSTKQHRQHTSNHLRGPNRGPF
jgi:hypothetical protein